MAYRRRVTEDGQPRITEAGGVRVLEDSTPIVIVVGGNGGRNRHGRANSNPLPFKQREEELGNPVIEVAKPMAATVVKSVQFTGKPAGALSDAVGLDAPQPFVAAKVTITRSKARRERAKIKKLARIAEVKGVTRIPTFQSVQRVAEIRNVRRMAAVLSTTLHGEPYDDEEAVSAAMQVFLVTPRITDDEDAINATLSLLLSTRCDTHVIIVPAKFKHDHQC